MRHATLAALVAAAVCGTCAPAAAGRGVEAPRTLPAASVGTSTATVQGILDPNGRHTTSYYFSYRPGEGTCGEGTHTETNGPLTGRAVPVQAELTGLTPNTTYSFCLVAVGAGGETASGQVQDLTTAIAPPLFEGQSASVVTQTGALLTALIDPELQPTTCTGFQYVADAAFARSGWSEAGDAACVPGQLPAAEEPLTTSTQLVGLQPNTIYHYRVLAENGSGPVSGPDSTLRTLPPDPAASTGSAVEAAVNSATLTGTVIPGSFGPNSDTAYFFEWGATPGYGHDTPVADAGQGTAPVAAAAALTGLAGGSVYHFRLVAENDAAATPQFAFGGDRVLDTVAAPPRVEALAATSVTATAATIDATLDGGGAPARYELKLGLAPGALATVSSGQTNGGGPLAIALQSLTPATTYYAVLRVIGANAPATVVEAGAVFQTGPGPAGTALLPVPPGPELLPTPAASTPRGVVLSSRTVRPPAARRPARRAGCRHAGRSRSHRCGRRQAKGPRGTGRRRG